VKLQGRAGGDGAGGAQLGKNPGIHTVESVTDSISGVYSRRSVDPPGVVEGTKIWAKSRVNLG
jgi:hypothetical protein